MVLLSPFMALASATTDDDEAVLRQWQAGSVVSMRAVERFGIERCFVSEPIGDAVYARMRGKSLPDGARVKRDELRYLKVLHYNGKGEIALGEMVCNAAIADDLTDIFKSLFKAHYPIELMLLIDNYDADDERSMTDNNSSCFCYRVVANSTKLSKHAMGLAVDINPLYNPYVKRRSNGSLLVQPAKGKDYLNRRKHIPYKIDTNDLCYRLFIEHGFSWGGAWRSLKDYQHFEK